MFERNHTYSSARLLSVPVKKALIRYKNTLLDSLFHTTAIQTRFCTQQGLLVTLGDCLNEQFYVDCEQTHWVKTKRKTCLRTGQVTYKLLCLSPGLGDLSRTIMSPIAMCPQQPCKVTGQFVFLQPNETVCQICFCDLRHFHSKCYVI